MSIKLPDPKVDVTQAQSRDSNAEAGSVDIVISRGGGKAKSYRTTGGNVETVVKDAVEKILRDPYTGEWLP